MSVKLYEDTSKNFKRKQYDNGTPIEKTTKRKKSTISDVKSMTLRIVNDVYDNSSSDWTEEDVCSVLKLLDAARRSITARHGEPIDSSSLVVYTPPYIPRGNTDPDYELPSLLT